jgi:hypothetical protein
MKRPARLLVVAPALVAALTVASATPASAHERRTVGDYLFVVGWGDEPAYTGFKNSVQVTLSEASGNAVTDLGDSLKVEVTKGSDKTTVPLVANFRVGSFGTPGDYRAWITPTRAGTYSFHFTGSIRGQAVDETFTSSKTTFNDIEDVSAIEFPAKDPSTGQISSRLDREIPRLDTRAEGVEASVRRADDRAGTARTLAAIGCAVGILGLLAGGAALASVRRRATTGGGGGNDGGTTRAAEAGSLTR